MIAGLLVIALLFYAVFYSGLASLKGTPVGVWESLTGATPAGSLGSSAVAVAVNYERGSRAAPNPVGAAVVAAARAYRWTYSFGQPSVSASGCAAATRGDCSGLVGCAYLTAARIRLPHNAAQMYAGCVKIAKGSVSDGDLIFYTFGAERILGHVAIASNGGRSVIDSLPSRGGVTEHARSENARYEVGYGRPAALVVGSGGGSGQHR